MTSYNSSSGLSYSLSKRRLPRSQTEVLPVVDDGNSTDEDSIKASSFRANFLPPGVDFGPSESVLTYGSLKSESLLSPVFSQLSMVRPEKLRHASEEAQALRRKLMRGANVLIIQGGYAGKRFIYDRLKELGVRVTIIDGPDSVWGSMVDEGAIADFVPLDFTDHSTVFARAMEAVGELMAGGVKFDACCTYFEDAVCLAARIATALGLEMNSIDACEKARNKSRTREVMAASGLPAPRFARVMNAKDLPDACARVGFPAILKPVFGAASLGVTRVDSKEEVMEVYKKLEKIMDVNIDPIWAQGKECVLEEFYDGDEFDIDMLLSNGEVVYAKVSDNWSCWPPWFQETGTNCPSTYAVDRQQEITQLAIDTTLVLGFQNGCFHVEAKYTSRGPRIIEVNARMGGVSVRDVNLTAWGVDLVEEHMMSALRIPIRPLLPEKPLKFMAESAVNAPFSGIVTEDNWLDFVLEDKEFEDVSLRLNYFKKKNARVQGPEDGMPDWLVEVICVSDVSQEYACDVIRKIVVEKAPVPIKADVPAKERAYFFPHGHHPFAFHANGGAIDE